MILHQFNPTKGIYQFELDTISTEPHAHPAYEVLFSPLGGIALDVAGKSYSHVSFAIISPNCPHQIQWQDAQTSVLMAECHPDLLQPLWSTYDIELSEGFHVSKAKADRTAIIEAIVRTQMEATAPLTQEPRVQKCLHYLNHTASEYSQLIQDLTAQVHLSDSRLSHLFKAEMGISIKKYFVWARLKRAFEQVISEDKNMYEAALDNGFYDQAHLSKAFKHMLGISPSEVYNSRMIQA